MNDCFYDLGHQQNMLFVSGVDFNDNVWGFDGGVNHNFWLESFFCDAYLDLTDWKDFESY